MQPHNTLGLARRAGGVDHVGRIIRAKGAVARRAGQVCSGVPAQFLPRCRVVEDQARDAGGQEMRRRRRRQDERRRTIPQHVGDPRGRIVGIERDVGRPHLEDTQQRRHHLDGARNGKRHPVAGTEPSAGQVVRKAIGFRVELPVAPSPIPGHKRYGIGPHTRLLLEEVRHGRGRDRLRGRIPGMEDRVALSRCQQLDAAHRRVRLGGSKLLQHADKAAAILRQLGLGVVRGIGDHVDTLPRRLVSPVVDDLQVLHAPVAERIARDRVAAEGYALLERGEVDVGAADVGIARLEAQVAPQVLGAIALMAHGAAHAARGPGDHLPDCVRRRDRDPQRHRVRGHADDRSRSRADPGRHRHADHHLPRAGHAIEVDRGRRDDQRRWAGTVTARQLFQVQRMGDTAGGLDEAGWPRRRPPRQRHSGWRVGELLQPVGPVALMMLRAPVGELIGNDVPP